MPKNSFNFDQNYWSEIIQQPDWYLKFVPYAKEVQKKLGENSAEASEFRKTARHFFEKALLADQVALASSGPNLDDQRQAVDTIVIHHTSGKPGYRLSYMEATQLLNIYAPYYMNPAVKEERGLKGQAVWSGHFRGNRQTFVCYHWLMRMDGSFERLLPDSAIGWHAGNWDINCRSIGICLDNDYENHDPSEQILHKLAAHIGKNYPGISRHRIMGHCEARAGTDCPGTNFIDGWKPKLIEYLS